MKYQTRVILNNFIHIHKGNRHEYEKEIRSYLEQINQGVINKRPELGLATHHIDVDESEYILYLDDNEEITAGVRLISTMERIVSDLYMCPNMIPRNNFIWEISDVHIEIDSNSSIFEEYAYFDEIIKSLYHHLFIKIKEVLVKKRVGLVILIIHEEELENIRYFGNWYILMSSILWQDDEALCKMTFSIIDLQVEHLREDIHLH